MFTSAPSTPREITYSLFEALFLARVSKKNCEADIHRCSHGEAGGPGKGSEPGRGADYARKSPIWTYFREARPMLEIVANW